MLPTQWLLIFELSSSKLARRRGRAQLRKIVIFKDYKGGEAIEAVFPDDGYWYPAKVLKANEDGTFAVKWEDPDGGPEQSDVQPKDMKYPPIPWEKLEVGQKRLGRPTGCFCSRDIN